MTEQETRCPNCNSTDAIVIGGIRECFNCDKFSYTDEQSVFETELNELLHTPVFISYDGSKPHLAILMRDDHQDAWMGGLRTDDMFYTSQVVRVDSEANVYPTIHVVQVEREVA